MSAGHNDAVQDTGSSIYEKFKENTQKIFNAEGANSPFDYIDTLVSFQLILHFCLF